MDTFFSQRNVRKILLSIIIVCAVGFLVTTGFVIKDKLRSLDFNLTVKLQDKIPARFDPHFVDFVDLGSMEVQTVLIATALLLLPVRRKLKVLLAIAYILGLLVTLLGKNFLPQPAPPFMLQRGSVGFSFPSSHVQVDSSYPSGHTYRVIFLASLVTGTYLVTKKHRVLHLIAAVATCGFALLVMTGLILLGKHWTTDVIGGIFLAAGLVGSSLYFLQKTP